MIRTAEIRDVPRIVAMAKRFYDAAPQPWPWSEDDMTETVESIIENGFAAISERGFILGVRAENPISRQWLIAKEFLWWSEDGQGMELMKAFRNWAKEIGADEINTSCPYSNYRVRKVYARHGEPVEIVYSEVI